MFDVPSSQASWKLGLSKFSELYQLSVWGGGAGCRVPQTSSSYSAEVFICFHGNHEPIRKCACEVFTEDHSDWLFEMLQIA